MTESLELEHPHIQRFIQDISPNYSENHLHETKKSSLLMQHRRKAENLKKKTEKEIEKEKKEETIGCNWFVFVRRSLRNFPVKVTQSSRILQESN